MKKQKIVGSTSGVTYGIKGEPAFFYGDTQYYNGDIVVIDYFGYGISEPILTIIMKDESDNEFRLFGLWDYSGLDAAENDMYRILRKVVDFDLVTEEYLERLGYNICYENVEVISIEEAERRLGVHIERDDLFS